MPSILIVCTANICRSPMAEAILTRLISARPDAEEWHIVSAGTWAIPGRKPALLSRAAMETMGMDISTHQSQAINKELMRECDLILTMENQHKEGLEIEFPRYKDRIYTLGEMVGSGEDIRDPMGGEPVDYEATARRLEQILTTGLDRIIHLALDSHSTRAGSSSLE